MRGTRNISAFFICLIIAEKVIRQGVKTLGSCKSNTGFRKVESLARSNDNGLYSYLSFKLM